MTKKIKKGYMQTEYDGFQTTVKWRHGFVHSYTAPFPTKQRVDSQANHLDSLSAVVAYKIVRISDNKVLAEKGKI